MNKRIVFITHRLNHGGAQRMLTFVANSCANFFEEVIFISMYNEKIEFEVDNRIKIIFLPGNMKFPTYKRSVFLKVRHTTTLIKLIRRELKKIKPDLVCAFGVNHVTLTLLSKVGLGIKMVGSERRSPQNLSKIWRKISELTYSKCDGMVFQLEEARDFYNDKIINKSIVIPNPYIGKNNKNIYDVKQRKNIISAAAARFEYEKGFDTLINAFSIIKKKHKEFNLVIYGKGDPVKHYGELIDKLGLNDSVEFPGIVKNVSEEIIKSTVFVLPSRSEGIPNVLLEVMGVGIPTVSCDCPPGGPRLLTDNGKRAILVPVDDYISLANGICRIIEDESLANSICSASQQVREEFNDKKIAETWIQYFNNILN